MQQDFDATLYAWAILKALSEVKNWNKSTPNLSLYLLLHDL